MIRLELRRALVDLRHGAQSGGTDGRNPDAARPRAKPDADRRDRRAQPGDVVYDQATARRI